nr:uncharacterized protein LOC108005267 [Drosophila suzukii]
MDTQSDARRHNRLSQTNKPRPSQTNRKKSGKKNRNDNMEGKSENFQKEANITINGYLNFLNDCKKRFCGISPQDLIRFGAREWNNLPLQEKDRFKNMDVIRFGDRL